MSDLLILRQPRACQPNGVEFLHAPSFAWYVRSIVDADRFDDILESDITAESLMPAGEDTWAALADSGLIREAHLTQLRGQLRQADGSSCFYPVIRLRPAGAEPIKLTTHHSLQEQDCENEGMLTALAANRLQVTRSARQCLGSGELQQAGTDHRSAIELLELELSDESLLLGWGWVWYKV